MVAKALKEYESDSKEVDFKYPGEQVLMGFTDLGRQCH